MPSSVIADGDSNDITAIDLVLNLVQRVGPDLVGVSAFTIDLVIATTMGTSLRGMIHRFKGLALRHHRCNHKNDDVSSLGSSGSSCWGMPAGGVNKGKGCPPLNLIGANAGDTPASPSTTFDDRMRSSSAVLPWST